ncbi:hypothetical protein EVAR_5160_1 [Eumeta japonica]|uniref:Uncharacterized protein n=1 Tax=Eumeta variegata TaxID=151549 RepID=A0A4C1SVA2_EUMVA|nr:hypothetical protein EVAR_5160_1 [Eumeta japonica]
MHPPGNNCAGAHEHLHVFAPPTRGGRPAAAGIPPNPISEAPSRERAPVQNNKNVRKVQYIVYCKTENKVHAVTPLVYYEGHGIAYALVRPSTLSYEAEIAQMAFEERNWLHSQVLKTSAALEKI